MASKRVLSAIIAIPLLLFFVIIGGIIFKVGVMIITAIALYEYKSAYKKTDKEIMSLPLIVGYTLYFALIFINRYDLILPVIYIVILISMSEPIFESKYSIVSSALTIMGYIYIVNFFGLLILIEQDIHGSSTIWLVFIIAFFCDTAAYYSGKFFGKRKLCPEVSPKKTVEGSIGGIIASTVGVILWGILNRDLQFQWYQLAMLGIIGGMISQLGDLSASLTKRYVGIKDYGNIMPGHGGILDRFDSILFTAPIVYYYVSLFVR